MINSPMNPAAEDTLAKIKDRALIAGVHLEELFAKITKDREGPVREEHVGHYRLVAGSHVGFRSFIVALTQLSYTSLETASANVGSSEFSMPGGHVKVAYSVARPELTSMALMSFTPDPPAYKVSGTVSELATLLGRYMDYAAAIEAWAFSRSGERPQPPALSPDEQRITVEIEFCRLDPAEQQRLIALHASLSEIDD